jgi:adenylate kinase family enzyme
MTPLTQSSDLKPRPERGVFLLLGKSGSGKGTLAKQLLAAGIVKHHISMGDLLRNMIARIQNNPSARAQLEDSLSDPDSNWILEQVDMS